MARKAKSRSTGGKYEKAKAAAREARVGSQVWKPEKEGEAIAGKVIQSSWRDGANGEYCAIIIDDEEAKESNLVRLGAVLIRAFHGQKIKLGAEVGIAYHGTQPSGRGRPTRLFAVVVIKDGDGELIVDDERFKQYEQMRERKDKGKRKGKAVVGARAKKSRK